MKRLLTCCSSTVFQWVQLKLRCCEMLMWHCALPFIPWEVTPGIPHLSDWVKMKHWPHLSGMWCPNSGIPWGSSCQWKLWGRSTDRRLVRTPLQLFFHSLNMICSICIGYLFFKQWSVKVDLYFCYNLKSYIF